MVYSATFQPTGAAIAALTGTNRGEGMGPIRDASGKQVQPLDGLRAAARQYVDRYNRFTDWTWQTAWVIDGPLPPLAWYTQHLAALDGQGLLIVSEDGTDTFVPDCVITARAITPIGATMTIEYHAQGAVAQLTNPNSTRGGK